MNLFLLLLQLLFLILLCDSFSLIITQMAFLSSIRECLCSPCWTGSIITTRTIPLSKPPPCFICVRVGVTHIPADAGDSLPSSAALSSLALTCHDKRQQWLSVYCPYTTCVACIQNVRVLHLVSILIFLFISISTWSCSLTACRNRSPTWLHQHHQHHQLLLCIILSFWVTKKWKLLPAAERAVTLVSSLCSSSCENT